MIDELVATALLGTRTLGLRLPTLPDELASVLPADAPGCEADAESRLLDAAAAATVYVRAGRKPRRDVAMPRPCPADRRPECSPAAADILAGLVDAHATSGGEHPLLVEWLTLATAAGVRPPHRLLPRLLDAAATRRAVRGPLAATMDERGRWLAQFNARWQFTAAPDGSPLEAWQVGTRDRRAEALRTIRNTNPAQAREWIAATWKEDSAELRAEWVACLAAGLTGDDEAFLETCLDDRSIRVREAAADLLARLPQSRFVRRMIDRAANLVAFEPGAAGSVLKLSRGKPATWRVALPASFDKELQRDGLTEKPPESFGPKQWQLAQILGCVPLAHWTETYGVAADDLVAAAKGEFAAVFLRGWLAALARIAALDWLGPLLAMAGENVRLPRTVLDAVPPAKRGDVLAIVARGPGRPAADLGDVLAAWRELDETVSLAVLERYDLPTLLFSEAHFHLHPRALERLEALLGRWGKALDHQRRVDQVLAIAATRRTMHRELAR